MAKLQSLMLQTQLENVANICTNELCLKKAITLFPALKLIDQVFSTNQSEFCFLCCFHPILVTWFLFFFGDEVTKILRNSLFIFYFLLFFIFILPVLPCKPKTSYRKSCNLSDEKQKWSYQNIWWARQMWRKLVRFTF